MVIVAMGIRRYRREVALRLVAMEICKSYYYKRLGSLQQQSWVAPQLAVSLHITHLAVHPMPYPPIKLLNIGIGNHPGIGNAARNPIDLGHPPLHMAGVNRDFPVIAGVTLATGAVHILHF